MIDKEVAKLVAFFDNKSQLLLTVQNNQNNDDFFVHIDEIKQIIHENQQNFLKNMPSGAYKEEILLKLLKDAKKPQIFCASCIKIYQKEVDFLCNLPKKKLIKELFYTLIIWNKLNPHPSGWIHFEFEEILRILFTEKEISTIKRDAFSKLIELGLEFRVIGSKEAIPCFKLPPDAYLSEEDADLEECRPIFECAYENGFQIKKFFEEVISNGEKRN